uniref:Beta-defensin-like domain-containing protein n=1 Tax=Terrapene triunguis TaxID=2587831 RepID=A0A674J676_9SAUR
MRNACRVEITPLIYSALHMETKKKLLVFAGFTQAQNIIQCTRLGGSCRRGSCPSGFARIGTCSGSDSCCL